MSKIKLFFNKNYKILILIFSINPIINIIFDNKSKEIFYRNSIYFYLIGFISMIFYGLYLVNNERIFRKIQIEKITLSTFALSNVFLSFYGFGLLYIYIYSILIASIICVILRVLVTRYSSKINSTKDSELKLYESRKPSKERILKILNENSKSLILVDGEWGIGKTFFMDRVLEEEKNIYYEKKELLNPKNILAVKVDVLLFNEKKQMINFVMEEIHKVLLEKGIRSSSIRKYLSAINDGVNNKFVKALHKLFSDEKTENIENNIKDDIKSLNGEKLVIIVDNLERTLDKKVTIDILGFLHYIYEKLGINIVVLADSDKLRNEISRECIGSEDYLDKFFIEKIKMKEVKIEEILDEFLKLEENKQFEIFNQILVIVKSLEDEISDKKKEFIGNINGNIEQDKEKIGQMDDDYYIFTNKLINPRNYQLIKNEFERLKEEVEIAYEIRREELKNHQRTILSMAIYLIVFKEKFDKRYLKDMFPLRYLILYNEYNEYFSLSNFFSKEKAGIAYLNQNIVELINFPSNEIVEGKRFLEKVLKDEQLIEAKEPDEIIKIIDTYYEALFSLNSENKDKLIQFFRVARKKLKNKCSEINFDEGNFESLIILDRILTISGEESLINYIFSNRDDIRIKEDNSENKLMNSLAVIYNEMINKISKIPIEESEYHRVRGLGFIKNKMVKCNNDSDPILNVIKTIEKYLENNKVIDLEKEYIKYFVILYEIYCFKNGKSEEKTKENIDTLKKVVKKIKGINMENSMLSNSIDDQLKYRKNNFELNELESKKYDSIYEILDDSISDEIGMRENLERVKLVYSITGEHYNYMIGYTGIDDIYKEFVGKGFKPDEKFEEILKKANIDIFSEEMGIT